MTATQQGWQRSLSKKTETFQAIAQIDRWDGWSRNWRPDKSAEDDLSYGLEILYGDRKAELGRTLVARAAEVADRFLREGDFTSGGREFEFPENRGNATRIRFYARALLGDTPPIAELASASKDIAARCATVKARQWLPPDEAAFLTAIRTALISGETAHLVAQLERRNIRWNGEEFALLRELVLSADPPSMRERFRAWFDRVRVPDFRAPEEALLPPGMVRWETAVLWVRLFSGGSESPSYRDSPLDLELAKALDAVVA